MIGDGLVRAGFITQKQMDLVLAQQRTGDRRRFGEIAIALDYLSDEDMLAYLVQWAGGRPMPGDQAGTEAQGDAGGASGEDDDEGTTDAGREADPTAQ